MLLHAVTSNLPLSGPSNGFKAQSATITVSQYLDECQMDHLLLSRTATNSSTGRLAFELELVASAPGLVDMKKTA